MTEVATVYLARAVNSIEPFRKFLASYDRFRGGMPNQLIIVFKGFHSEQETREYEEAAAQFEPLTLRLRDFGHDIRAYREAVRRFDFPFFCFFNSSSEIL